MAAPAPCPFDRQDINEHLVLFVDDSKTLACMALVCPAWWHAARRSAGYRLRALAGHTGFISALVSLPGGLLASGSEKPGHVRVWEVGTGRLVQTLTVHDECKDGRGNVTALASLPNGLLASGTEDSTVRVELSQIPVLSFCCTPSHFTWRSNRDREWVSAF